MSAATLPLDFGGEETTSPLAAPRLLLEQLRRRGVTVAANGAKLAFDAPRGALDDLLPDLQRFKPQLLELLEADAPPRRPSWRDRTPGEWEAVARESSTGAAAICSTLRDFVPLLESARAGTLPLDSVRVEIGGEVFDEPDATGLLIAVEKEWTARAQACNRDGRGLSIEEEVALESARELLKWLNAARGESGWFDLEAVADEIKARANEVSR